MPTPAVEPPPKPFKTAEEHYKYLLEKAHGGTKHTMSTNPGVERALGRRQQHDALRLSGQRHAVERVEARSEGQGRRADAAVREAIQGAAGRGREIRRAALRPAHELRIPRRTALALGAVRQGVREHAGSVLVHERHDERDATHLYRRRAHQYGSQALSARRQHRLLGRRQARDLDEVGESGRLRTRHAAHEQPVRDGGDVAGAAQRVRRAACSSRRSRSTIRSRS